ncbi:MAG: hypothetical protein GY777_18785 [Candidatus Brocadiaceae bacterium]|nr:hypothetical protein [Candidatus Brocadiaceae bacterium]
MDIIKKRSVYLYTSLFFVAVNIINTAYQLGIKDYSKMRELLLINSVLCVFFLIPYIMNLKNIEIFYGVILLSWVVFSLIIGSGNIVDYSILTTYCIMLIIKQTKFKATPVIIISLILFSIAVVDMILNDGNIARLANNILLVGVMSLVHYFIYYKEYKQPINLKAKYNLEEWHIKAIDLIIKDNPTVSEMTEELNQSISTVNSYLKTIYDKMGIPEGGNRKAGLILKLAQLGYISH